MSTSTSTSSAADTKAAERKKNEFILTNVRLSFPKLVTPEAMGKGAEPDSKPRYGACFLLDPKDPVHAKLIDSIKARALEIYKAEAKANPKADKIAIQRGFDPETNEADHPGYEGMWVLKAARAEKQGRPLLIDRQRKPYIDYDVVAKAPAVKQDAALEKLVKENLYAGSYVNAKIRIFFVDYEGVKRVTASVEVVQRFKDGEPFSNSTPTADDMPEMDDDVPFDADDTPPDHDC